MKYFFEKIKSIFATKAIQKTAKIVGYFFIGIIVLLLVFATGLRIYFEKNKTEIVSKINSLIDDNTTGDVKIGAVDYRFLIGFPNFTVVLNNVEVKDSLFAIHKRELLKAKEIEARLNVLSLLKNEINIHKVVIIDATIDLFKDKNGVSNSNLFKPKKKKPKEESDTSASIDEVVLRNVNFISENQNKNKLFSFQITHLKSKVAYSGDDWETELDLKTVVKSLAFNSEKGSFAKDKMIQGKLKVTYSDDENIIRVTTSRLNIGEDVFRVKAYFNVGKDNSVFAIALRTSILWKNASNLLANNISSKLNQFDLKTPFPVSCGIKGDLSVVGDPIIIVNTLMENNELNTSYGVVTNCSFKGKFTNYYTKGLGCTDPNSAIIITNFRGDYEGIPITIPSAIINDLKKTIATGNVHSEFDVVKMQSLIGEDLIHFTEGKAKIDLDFKVGIVDLRFNKPHFKGNIIINDASFEYKPKNMSVHNSGFELYFTDQYLDIKNLKIQNGKNIVFMEGKVANFLNLYYDAPEKMMVQWKAYSPYLDIKEMLRILSYKDKTHPVKKKTAAKKSSKNQLKEVLNKSQATIDLKVDKMVFSKMTGTDFKVKMDLFNGGFYLKNGSMKGAKGGAIAFEAQLVPKNNVFLFGSEVSLSNGMIDVFLASFNNFGIKSFSPNNIKGKLSLDASLSGILDSNKELLTRSLRGNFKFHIKNGALINFRPVQKIGKLVFPNRDVNTITFSDLYAITTIKGDEVNVKEFKMTSNVLNMDVSGIYSLSNTGTSLGIRIPLRNPEDDYKETDAKKREELRYKGIVVNLLVVDGKDGNAKIKLGKRQENK